jgi:hypothetical protein
MRVRFHPSIQMPSNRFHEEFSHRIAPRLFVTQQLATMEFFQTEPIRKLCYDFCDREQRPFFLSHQIMILFLALSSFRPFKIFLPKKHYDYRNIGVNEIVAIFVIRIGPGDMHLVLYGHE